jgi:predicted TPR repeat methyltransferase
MSGSVPTSHFDALYAAKADPWDFTSSEYEQAKYAATLAALAGRRFSRGLEVGCSIGVLTRRLAAQCDRLLAVDVAQAALEAARARCGDLPQVEIAEMRVPGTWPEGMFDLVVLSEVLYFLDAADLRTLAGRVTDSLAPDGCVLLVNWCGETGGPHGGEAAAELFLQACGARLSPLSQQRDPSYRLDLLTAAR